MALATVAVLTGCTTFTSAGRVDPANTAFNATEAQLGLTNVGGLTELATATIGPVSVPWTSPVVASGFVYVSAEKRLEVFSADGSAGCTGAPRTCQPLWTADLGDHHLTGSPTVSKGTVFVTGYPVGSSNPATVFAFDARGKNGCTAPPVTCAPLWTAAVGYATPPTVLHDLLYVAGVRSVAVLDANGVRSCSGSPKVCTPLWSTATIGSASLGAMGAPTVGDQLYVQDDVGTLYAYDALGVTNCAGTPAVCAPQWTAPGHHRGSDSFLGWVAPVLDGERVITYTAASTSTGAAAVLSSYDAAGEDGCAGTPTVCTPQWSALTDGSATDTQLAVAYGTIFVITDSFAAQISPAGTISAYRDDGAGCSGVPMTCPVQWTNDPYDATWGRHSAPVVANGLMHVMSTWGIASFDARGTTGCSGAGGPVIKTCAALGRTDFVPSSSTNLAVADGKLYALVSEDGSPATATLHVYG